MGPNTHVWWQSEVFDWLANRPITREVGWSRWVEPEPPCYADDFLEDWGDAIVQLHASNHYELNREASAWQRAMPAYAQWRAV